MKHKGIRIALVVIELFVGLWAVVGGVTDHRPLRQCARHCSTTTNPDGSARPGLLWTGRLPLEGRVSWSQPAQQVYQPRLKDQGKPVHREAR